MNSKAVINSVVGVLGGITATLFGGWSAAMSTLVLFMAADYITGLLVAGVFHKSGKSENGGLESRAGFKGLCRKAMMLLVVMIAYRVDLLAGTTVVKDAVVIAFCCNEAISILENGGAMGIPYPNALKKAIDMLNKEDVA